jgi:hypothetical protein
MRHSPLAIIQKIHAALKSGLIKLSYSINLANGYDSIFPFLFIGVGEFQQILLLIMPWLRSMRQVYTIKGCQSSAPIDF